MASPTVGRAVHNSASATALMLMAELVAPIALFYGLRSVGAGIYLAVIVGGIGPALSTTVKAICYHRVDGLAVAVLITLVVSPGVSVIGGGPQFLLARDSLLTAAWGSWFFISLWSADLVPGLGGALWLVTFVALQVITNIYFIRSGLWTILLGDTPGGRRGPDAPRTDAARGIR